MEESKKTPHPVAQLASSNSMKQDFNALLIDSVSEVLTELLSKKVTDAFYDHLETEYSFPREEIPQRLNDFLLILERTFGKGGQVVERCIAKKMYAKLGWEPDGSPSKLTP